VNIEGLDYNTQREKLILPEYGREVQKMVDHAITIEDRTERQHCAETIVQIMGKMLPQNNNEDHEQMLWDHLALMSGFKLDIDYPYDVTQALKIASKPEPLGYPMTNIPVRHYGKMMFEVFEHLKTMPEGPERDELVRITANQMKRSLMQWGHGSADDEKVASDLARFTDGVIQLDLSTFKFEKINERELKETRRKKK
jgi:hypothetical protein